ncbi:ribonuclease HI family protein [Arthrobacter sp. 35W]|uniref:ribonuclease HI family protein n=1 Tax=Arthrobacter sp. 35W TaxID=1132441 RepID=UPI0003F73CC1|nr:ribonuclease HI family protein [Arthrobacter sp. 35W]
MTIVAAADGSALGNPGPAGWAWYVDENCWQAGGWPHGTNNQGELMAVLDLFRSTAHLPNEPLRILCDSQYVINCITKWMPGWKRKGWRKADGKPVLNVDLLKDIDAAIVGRSYTFEWVKGHAGHDLNEAADDKARAAATAYQAKRQPPRGPGFPGAVDGGTAASPAGQLSSSPVHQAAPQQSVQLDHEQPDLFSALADEDAAPFARTPADAVVALERELLDPSVRADSTRVATLLHPDFEEIGASGRLWTRDAVLDELVGEAFAEPAMDILNVAMLDGTTALLTYRSTDQRGSSLRSSLWRHADGQWRLRFHQGTPEA